MTTRNDLLETILIPTDGSDGALVGAERGIDLAGSFGADVHVLSVVDEAELDAASASDIDDEQKASIEAEAESAVETVADVVHDRHPELEITTAIERGTPHRVIGEYAEEADIDAITMGTKGWTGLDRVLLGSVTEHVLRTVTVPVLAVPPEASDSALTPDAVENVLLPTDGSEGATVAVEWGIGLANAYDAMCHVLFSADKSRFTGGAEPSAILTGLKEEGRTALETIRERARAAGISVTGTVANGPAVRVILDYAEDNEIDLIVMGTHGRSGIERQLLGSVTENVVRHADVPVCCIPIASD
ncbi:universal stress protein [Natrarchaeobius oligotrophus]|uniref:Universal stress protein n=1 Tax=Natrarchaeobius chitinivorans TaxID=1679083 RepID=A0A3N6MX58_NATCH|nr:universal stress protein [Natrarchaeobius chitinivorans]RQG99586.1 universal stress protein [Natrarchaeobius chitinivorans]